MGSADPDEEDSPALLLFAGWGGWGRRSGGASREEKEEERWRAGPGAPGLSGKPTARLPGGGGGARARGQSRPQARSGRERAHLAAVHVEEQLHRPVHAGAARHPTPESPTALPPEPTRQPSPREKVPLRPKIPCASRRKLARIPGRHASAPAARRSLAEPSPPRADSPRPRRALRPSAGAPGPAASPWSSFIGAYFKGLNSHMCSCGTSRILCHCSHHASTTPGTVLIKQSHSFQLCREGT